MAEQEPESGAGKPTPISTQADHNFKPVGTMIIMVIYILVFAVAWGSVYFGQLLARR